MIKESCELISFIIPIYNSEKTLEKCLDSILNQKRNHKIEIILIDDCSTDNTSKICENYVLKYPDILVYKKNNKNSGVSFSRNIGIKNASGNKISFIDSDDYLNMNYLNVISEYNQDVDLIVFGMDVRDEIKNKTNRIIYDETYLTSQIEINSFFSKLNARLHSSVNKVYKKAMITELFKENINKGEDLLFNLSYIDNCRNIAVSPESLYNYVIHSNESLSRQFNTNELISLKSQYRLLVNYFNGKGYSIGDIREVHNNFYQNTTHLISSCIKDKSLSNNDKKEYIKGILISNEFFQAKKYSTLPNTFKNFILKVFLKEEFSIVLLFVGRVMYYVRRN